MKKLKYIHLFENFSLNNLETLNEDNLEVKNIARQLYSFLKKNGVREVSLSTDKINIGKDSNLESNNIKLGDEELRIPFLKSILFASTETENLNGHMEGAI